jgi:hypothetical protein
MNRQVEVDGDLSTTFALLGSERPFPHGRRLGGAVRALQAIGRPRFDSRMSVLVSDR